MICTSAAGTISRMTMQELQEGMDAEAAQVEAWLERSHKEASSVCTKRLDAISTQLEEKLGQIEAAKEAFQVQVTRLWEDYRDIHAQLAPAKQVWHFWLQEPYD